MYDNYFSKALALTGQLSEAQCLKETRRMRNQRPQRAFSAARVTMVTTQDPLTLLT